MMTENPISWLPFALALLTLLVGGAVQWGLLRAVITSMTERQAEFSREVRELRNDIRTLERKLARYEGTLGRTHSDGEMA